MVHVLASLLLSHAAAADAEDPRLWLEEVTGDEALDWVRARNAESEAALGSAPGFEALRKRLLAIYDSDERIPYVRKRGNQYTNLWRDAEHPRGLWRRTTLESFRTDEPEWAVVLDLDALGEAEGENWVWDGARCLQPEQTRCMVMLSRGGADAAVAREYDTVAKAFVPGGFELEEAKLELGWIDADTLYVATDFGPDTLTDSGYARIVKEWKRGTPLSEAETVFEGDRSDISVNAWHDPTPGYERDFVGRSFTFYSGERYLRTRKGLVKIDKPDDAMAWVVRDWLLLELRSDWTVDGTTYTAGSLLAADFDRWMKGKRRIDVLFEPTERSSLGQVVVTKNHLILNTLVDVRNRLEVLTPGPDGWSRGALPGLPELGRVSVRAVDALAGDAYWLDTTDYLTPPRLGYGTVGAGEAETLKELPVLFDADGLEVTQHFATSKDGTKIPYFQVAPADLALDGSAPTLQYGYGGFEISLLPSYSAKVGAGWLERGGVYVVANIRGGGEYGPRWHQAALKQHRHKAYEDFAAVGADLVARGVTSPQKLGILGGSNGGLLMGNMYTQYPDQWGAVVCKVPLLDMRRYTKLLAGASWEGEYGDPDVPEEWAFIKTFSPYHLIDPSADPPPILFTTSTRDDRVHPGHARKMAHALLEGDEDVLYYENIEGGHGGAANHEQAAFMDALAYTFLAQHLGEPEEDQAPE